MRFRAFSVLVVTVFFFLEGSMGGGARAAGSASPSSSSPSKKSSSARASAPASQASDGVFGKISLSGPVPKLAPRPVNADAAICGRTDRPSPSLVLSKDRGVANAVVWLEGAKSLAPPKGPFRLDQKNCLFSPYVQVVSKGAPVVFLNSDPVLHNVHAATANSALIFNKAIPIKGQTFTETFSETGIVRVKCDIHTWMTAWLFVSDTTYAAVTDAEGRYAFPGVPPGTYRLKAWHELFGEKSQPVTVPASGAARGDVVLSLLDASN
ncbi:MAG: carboxypeptidase regulatory-like domain-containing protein [Acidobacteriota bacterium]